MDECVRVGCINRTGDDRLTHSRGVGVWMRVCVWDISFDSGDGRTIDSLTHSRLSLRPPTTQHTYTQTRSSSGYGRTRRRRPPPTPPPQPQHQQQRQRQRRRRRLPLQQRRRRRRPRSLFRRRPRKRGRRFATLATATGAAASSVASVGASGVLSRSSRRPWRVSAVRRGVGRWWRGGRSECVCGVVCGSVIMCRF